jgi:TonB-linked SusC/RagA family outer membrane protein
MKLSEKSSKNMFLLFVFLLFSLFSASSKSSGLLQDTRTINGIVSDIKGEPLIGVSILIKGTTLGTVTDLDGRYTLKGIADGQILEFTYVGFEKQEIQVKPNETIINVIMQDASVKMDDVVVIGYGTQKKESVVGSISTVSVKEIRQTATTSLANAISGRLPGIITRQSSGEPGFDAASVYIRGMSTWVNNKPLVLVDGIEREMSSVNPEEVESLSVMKDASATAVYGVRGANGVVLINTKKGKHGKPQVSFRTETAFLNSLSERNYIDGYEYALLMNEGNENSGKAPRWSTEELEKFRTGSDPYLYPNVDWISTVLKKSSMQTINNLSITGGTDVIRYYVNLGYAFQDGIYKEDKSNPYNTNANVNKYNYRSNVDINLSKDLTIELGIGGIIDARNYPGAGAAGIFNGLRDTGPIAFPATNPDGSISGTAVYIGSNPWAQSTQTGYSDENLTTIQSTAGAKWDLSNLITPGLYVKGRFAFDYYHANKALRYKSFGIKQYLGLDEEGNERYNIVREESPLGYSMEQHSNRAVYYDLSLNYDRTFEEHSFSGLLLLNRRSYDNLSAGNSISNLPSRNQGVAGRVTYNYDQRYFMEFNAGYNGSENFPKGNRMGFFPAISGGWLLSGEPFWRDNIVSNLKLRASYGKVGNDNIGGARFLYLTAMNKNNQGYEWGVGQYPMSGITEGQIGYNDITWETSTKTNLGVDIGFWKNNIILQTDFFVDKRDGILIQRQSVPSAAGFLPNSVLFGNLGKVDNRGFDALLEVKNRTASGLFYSFRTNVTFAKNQILENDKPTPLYSNLSEIGKPIGQPFGLVGLGFFKDQEDIDNAPDQSQLGGRPIPGDIKYKDVNGDGYIDTNDATAIGYPRDPQLTFGLGGTLEYKGIDLSIFFTGAARSSLFFEGRNFYPFENGMGYFNIYSEIYDNRWTPETAETAKYPIVTEGYNPQTMRRSTVWQKDASYLRLKNIEVGYTIPQRSIKKIGLSGMRIFVNGTNLHTWDKINSTIDPESDNWYPLQRSLNLGLSVNF